MYALLLKNDIKEEDEEIQVFSGNQYLSVLEQVFSGYNYSALKEN